MAICGNLSDVIRDYKGSHIDFTKNGECSNCGQCCSNFLPMPSSEVKRIKRYIEKNRIVEQKTLFPTSDITIDMTCPFRSEKSRSCLIYDVRPTICRMFQCNQSKPTVDQRKELMHKKYDVVDMRAEFYGHESKFGFLFGGKNDG